MTKLRHSPRISRDRSPPAPPRVRWLLPRDHPPPRRTVEGELRLGLDLAEANSASGSGRLGPRRSASTAPRDGRNSGLPRFVECGLASKRPNAAWISDSQRRLPVSLVTTSGASIATTPSCGACVPTQSTVSSSLRALAEASSRPSAATAASPAGSSDPRRGRRRCELEASPCEHPLERRLVDDRDAVVARLPRLTRPGRPSGAPGSRLTPPSPPRPGADGLRLRLRRRPAGPARLRGLIAGAHGDRGARHPAVGARIDEQ